MCIIVGLFFVASQCNSSVAPLCNISLNRCGTTCMSYPVPPVSVAFMLIGAATFVVAVLLQSHLYRCVPVVVFVCSAVSISPPPCRHSSCLPPAPISSVYRPRAYIPLFRIVRYPVAGVAPASRLRHAAPPPSADACSAASWMCPRSGASAMSSCVVHRGAENAIVDESAWRIATAMLQTLQLQATLHQQH